jgi:hypothetical protein
LKGKPDDGWWQPTTHPPCREKIHRAVRLNRGERFTFLAGVPAAGFALRQEAKRHAAFGHRRHMKSGVATALCHRTP